MAFIRGWSHPLLECEQFLEEGLYKTCNRRCITVQARPSQSVCTHHWQHPSGMEVDSVG